MSDVPAADPRTSVVLIAFNGRHRLERTLANLTALPERPEVILVDNGSTDGTQQWVADTFPQVRLIALDENIGCAGRNVGVEAATTPYVGMIEDDAWYEPGALTEAADLLDAHPTIGLIQAHVLVGDDERIEPLHADMVDTPVPDDPGLPGHRILSYLEGLNVVRREAYRQGGGYDRRLLVGGPEEHLATEMLRHGWELRYVPWVVAHHVPDHKDPGPFVRELGLRNTLWFAWLRRPLLPALRWSAHVIRASKGTTWRRRGVVGALRGLPWILRERNVVPAPVEAQLKLLDGPKRGSKARRYQ